MNLREIVSADELPVGWHFLGSGEATRCVEKDYECGIQAAINMEYCSGFKSALTAILRVSECVTKAEIDIDAAGLRKLSLKIKRRSAKAVSNF